MAQTYSAYEAKARFSEIIRKVRAGQRIIISHRGREVAEIRPLAIRDGGLANRLERMEEEGIVGPRSAPPGRLRPLARKPGALIRFLESRE
jgi:prevent-host-death family protein